jgi:BirA family transcriptional regulator, biotin operon repressor / biotin---[acetyl-CoA-carboxylase] ligase
LFNTIAPATLFTGRNCVNLPECHSTNDYTLNLLSEKEVPEGTIIITGNQTKGKGQRGNSWYSEPNKNLTFSLVFKPSFLPVGKQFYLNIITSLSVHQTLTHFIEKKVSIKWPNDVYVGDKKICGILIHNNLKGKNISSSVIGIGLNVNQKSFDLPAATSVISEIETESVLSDVLCNLLENLEKYYLLLKSEEFQKLRMLYLEKLYWLQETRIFRAEEEFKGEITGVTEEGLLQIDTGQVIREFSFKEVAYLY